MALNSDRALLLSPDVKTPPRSKRPGLKKVLEALHRLYAVHDIETFPQTLMAVVEDLVPCVAVSFDSVNLKTGEATDRFDRPVALPPAEFLARWQVFCHEHPGIAFLKQGGKASVFALTDFVSQREFERTAFHHEITQPCGVSRQLGVILPVPGFVAGMALCRDTDFSSHERTVIELLHPHFVQAFQNAQLLSSVRKPSQIDYSPWRDKGLTHRECDVLRWVMEGKRNHEIAVILEVHSRTVEKHVENILAKLGVETRTTAGAEARRLLEDRVILPFAPRAA